jgi:adenylosuccinate synthase
MDMSDQGQPQHTAVVGLQWGDEGKGKIVDLLTAEHDVVVRYNGGANAGHTVVVGDERYALHLIPSGILYPEKRCVIGNGVVIDPEQLLKEIDTMRERGIAVGDNLKISSRAHVVMPYHKAMDAALEQALAAPADDGEDRAIGTTRRGIGPAYADKVHRSLAVRMGDLLDAEALREKLRCITRIRSAELQALQPDEPALDPDALCEQMLTYGEKLRPYITDTTYLLHDCVTEGRRILFEGANACLLDVDHGTYPFVTSSNCSTLGIPAGTGLPGRTVQRAIGVMKAYSTRVGAGPFPTELFDTTAEQIRERGREYGTTTGRPRRCGWLDLVAVRYSAMICGLTHLAVTMLDVLSSCDEISICTAYRLPDGTITDRFIPDGRQLAQVMPVYETLPGWSDDLTGADQRGDLPPAAAAYLDRIEQFLHVPIELVSVGPERRQTLMPAVS